MNALADLLALDAPLDPTPIFTIEPADRGRASEIDRQATFLSLLRKTAPDVLAWAVPNGHNRGLKDRAKAKKEGLRAGVPDLTICWNRGVAFMEFKAGSGPLSDNQVELLNYLTAAGHHCAVVRTPEFAMQLLHQWGAPVRLVR